MSVTGDGWCRRRKQQPLRNRHGVPSPLSWSTSLAGDTGNLRCAPQTSPRKGISTALRATHSAATARKGGTPRERHGGPQVSPANRMNFCL